MFLTLEVVSTNAATLGGARRKVFSVEGGRIGRAPENEMVLPGAGVHRHHATVRFINGVFFIEGVGTNGIAINNPEVVLPRHEPYPLKSGDKVFIDEFELTATASAVAPAEPAAPRAPAREAMRPVAESTGPGARQPVPSLGVPIESAEDLDPLRQLTGSATARPGAPRPTLDPAWNHSSSLSDHFTPPPLELPANAIPENWDKTSFDRSKLQPAGPSAPPSSWGAAPVPQAPAWGTAGQAPTPRPVPSAPGAGSPLAGNAPQAPAFNRPPPASPAPRAAESGAGAAFDWEGFLRAAGVDPATVPPETAAVLGHIMRSVVQGLIEVLRARSEIKTEFRMPVTQVRVSENNPLKFAANAEDALSNLFGRRNAAYLGPQEAFEDAFNDVRFHQLAMLVGVRAGFDSLLSRFDPEPLQEAFERQGKRGLLIGGAKAKYWEMYVERFQSMVAERDETFRRLFGEEFARAYEQQLAVLKRGRGGTQR